ncbi:restriction endonuclease subunit S [Flintibacter muris]|uniref:restriction endonuclease subunit S n=1 Tax=Flintibacter muris TaxID=2941327 RepID=UPI00204222D2|nr:restriction endonuclease subunit S [Flintibacter muris]
MKWKTAILSDISTNIQTGPFGSQLHQSDYSIEGTPVVMPKDLVNGHISEATIARISDAHIERLNRHKIEIGDILYSRRGDVGRCAFATEKEAGWLCGTGCLRVSTDVSKANPKFVFYQLQKPDTIGWVEKHAVGATMLNLNTAILSRVPIEIPSLNTQNRIVDILSAYDNLIENNQKQIKLLEEAAQRLYKEWFVDLRFPGYEITPVVDGVPEGWELCRLEDVIEFNPKIPLSKERLKQSVPMSALSTSSMTLDTEEFAATFSNSGSKFQNGDTLLARITPCLENGKTAFVAGIESDEGAVGSTEFIVMRSKGLNPYMVYLLARDDSFRQSAINSMTGSDGRQRAQADKLKALPYLKPTDQITRLFAGYAEPIFLQIQKKNEQNVRLRQARDRLLPKLMSGEIEV